MYSIHLNTTVTTARKRPRKNLKGKRLKSSSLSLSSSGPTETVEREKNGPERYSSKVECKSLGLRGRQRVLFLLYFSLFYFSFVVSLMSFQQPCCTGREIKATHIFRLDEQTKRPCRLGNEEDVSFFLFFCFLEENAASNIVVVEAEPRQGQIIFNDSVSWQL